MTLPTLQQLQWLGAIVAIGVGVYTLGKPFVPPVVDAIAARTWRPVLAHFRGVHQMIADVGSMKVEITSIRRRVESELGPNGGGSMKDQVTVIAARQAAMFDGQITPAFQANADGRFVSVNRAFETMTGYPSRDLLEMGWVNLIHERMQEEFMIAWHHAISDARILRRSVVITTADGKHLAVCVDAVPVKVGARVIEWQGTFEGQAAA